MKIDRELRKDWIKHYTEYHHEAKAPGFYGELAKSRRFIAAAMREAMTRKRARRRTQQQQLGNAR